jgi:hypothetical protein
MGSMGRSQPSDALAAMWAADQQAGIDPLAPVRVEHASSTYDAGLTILPADFDAENLQAVGVTEDTRPQPAKPGARRWSVEQLTPDLGGQP